MIVIFFMWLIVLGVVVYIKLKAGGFVDNVLPDIENESSTEGIINNEAKLNDVKETFKENKKHRIKSDSEEINSKLPLNGEFK